MRLCYTFRVRPTCLAPRTPQPTWLRSHDFAWNGRRALTGFLPAPANVLALTSDFEQKAVPTASSTSGLANNLTPDGLEPGADPEMAKKAGAGRDLGILQQMLGLIPHKTGSMRDVVFVSIDCEAFEHAQHKITELGVSVLDTRDLVHVEEGAWTSKIKHAHYRPIEYRKLTNKRFLKGCPDHFNFGPSTWIRLSDASRLLSRIFQDPSSLQHAASFGHSLSAENRKVVVIGHDLTNDLTYLMQLGFPLSSAANIVHSVDTQILAASTKKVKVALRRLLLSLDLDPVNMHNAGNDAAYTLQAAVFMALREHATPGSVATGLVKWAVKMPPTKYTSATAPQLWAGTTTPEDREVLAGPRLAAEKPPSTTGAASVVVRKLEQRQRKQEIRAKDRVEGSVAQNRPQAAQLPLPSTECHETSNPA